MKLTKNQLKTIVATICHNESKRLEEERDKRRNSKEVQALVTRAIAEFSKISDASWRISQGTSCRTNKYTPRIDTYTDGAMEELGYKNTSYLPNGFREQIELKVQMCFIDAKDLKDLEKRVGYNFVIV